MPLEEQTTEPGQLNAMARQAHLIRTKDRLAWWRERLVDNPDEAMKAVALAELEKYERQLREPFTARTLRTMEQRQPSPMERMIQALQQEVADLKARFLGIPPAEPAQTSVEPVVEQAPAEPTAEEAPVAHET